MEKQKKFKKGFTLIELLVVVAIIGILASIVSVLVNSARSKGDDTAIKSNLHTVANAMELYYSNNGGSYGNSSRSNCSSAAANTIFKLDQTVLDAITEATKRSGVNYAFCNVDTNVWGVAVILKSDKKSVWCVDSTGISKQVTASVHSVADINDALNSTTYLCN